MGIDGLFMELLSSRRSIRNFADRPVAQEQVARLLEAGRLAPSRANSQPWRFVVVRDAELRRRLFRAVYHQEMVLQAPVLITVLGLVDPRDSVPARTFELVQAGALTEDVKNFADHVLDHWNEEELRTDAALNAAIAATCIMLAAHAEGLGCCWIKLCRDDEVLRILEVPEGYYHAATLAVGHPAGPPPGPRPRLPLGELVRYETFGRRERPS